MPLDVKQIIGIGQLTNVIIEAFQEINLPATIIPSAHSRIGLDVCFSLMVMNNPDGLWIQRSNGVVQNCPPGQRWYTFFPPRKKDTGNIKLEIYLDSNDASVRDVKETIAKLQYGMNVVTSN